MTHLLYTNTHTHTHSEPELWQIPEDVITLIISQLLGWVVTEVCLSSHTFLRKLPCGQEEKQQATHHKDEGRQEEQRKETVSQVVR